MEMANDSRDDERLIVIKVRVKSEVESWKGYNN